VAASPHRAPRRALWLLAAAALGATSSGALAHALDVGYLRLHAEGSQVHLSLDIDAATTQRLAGLPPLANPIGPAQAGAALAATLGSGPLTRAGKACHLGAATGKLEGTRLTLDSDAECAEESGPLSWPMPFLEKAPLTFRLLGQAQVDDQLQDFALEPGQELLSLAGVHHGFWEFVLMGVRHIGAMPSEWWGPKGLHLPLGLDHILFLLALILCDASLAPTLKAVTGFTLGHSLTLALSTFDVVRLPSRLTESLIALSIAYIAGEDFFASGALRKVGSAIEEPKHRWQLAAAFGLVHGFGLASALTDLHLSRAGTAKARLGFNLGVELGQELIVVIVAPILWLLYRNARIKRVMVPVGAAAIFAIGSCWFVQRAFS
jgi:hypothetical protein